MSMISELVNRLRAEAESMGKYGTSYMATLLTRSADAIVMLSEKVREPKQEWIPCSEKLPENGEDYLTYSCDEGYGWYQVLSYYDGWNCTEHYKGDEIDSVTAWMPLPDPPKGADNES